MKTISGKVVDSRPISLSKAAKFLTTFVSAETEASHAISAYLRRTSAAFNELSQLHRQLRGCRSDRNHKKHHRSHTLILDEAQQEGSRDPGPASVTNPVVESGREESFGDGESGGGRKKGKKKRKRNERGESGEGQGGSRNSGPASDANPSALDSGGRENGTGVGESGSLRKKGKKKEKSNEGGESGEGQGGSRNPASDANASVVDSGGREYATGVGESGSVRKKGKKKEKRNEGGGGSVDLSEKRGEIEERKDSVGIEVGKKKKKKNEEGKSNKLGEKRGEIEDRGREGEESVGIVEVVKKKKRKIVEAEGGNDVSEERHSSKKKRRRKGE